MTLVLILITLLCVALTAAAVGYLVFLSRRDKKRFDSEAAAADAARKYLEKFGIHSRISATKLTEGIVLMVETEPHKKLRFSYIIEQPMRKFVSESAGIWVSSVFWRFRVNPKQLSVPEVKYGEAVIAGIASNEMEDGPESTPSETPHEEIHADIESDDYFETSRQIHLEEASWDDFEDLLQSESAPKKPGQDSNP